MEVVVSYTLKCTFWEEAPWTASGIAHREVHVRTTAMERVLASDGTHPRVVDMRYGEALAEAKRFVEAGGEWPQSDCEIKLLRCRAMVLRLMFSSDWRVEGQHARAH